MLLEAALQFEHIIKHPKTDADGKVLCASLWDTVYGTCVSQAITRVYTILGMQHTAGVCVEDSNNQCLYC